MKMIMKIKITQNISIDDVKLGLYYIWWIGEGRSLASIYNDKSGNRWIAPVNWCSPDKLANHVNSIDRLELIYTD